MLFASRWSLVRAVLVSSIAASTTLGLFFLSSCGDSSDPTQLRPQDQPGTDAAPDVAADVATSVKSFNPCITIPSFEGRSQTVDGIASEFDGLDSIFFEPGFGRQSLTDAGATTMAPNVHVEGKVAWSGIGLHMFFHVKDATIIVSQATDAGSSSVFEGDGMQIFIGGTVPRTGVSAADGTDPTAWHIALVPPGRAATTNPNGRAVRLRDSDFKFDYVSHLVDDGYVMELYVPWLAVRPNPPVTQLVPKVGERIAFDFAIQYADTVPPLLDDGTYGRAPYSLLAVNENATDGNDCIADPATCPEADDRSWCQPTLQ